MNVHFFKCYWSIYRPFFSLYIKSVYPNFLKLDLVRPYITLSANHVDKRAEKETIIGFFNTMNPTYTDYYKRSVLRRHYGNRRYKYQLVSENCSSYPFVVYDNQLRLENQGERRACKNKGDTLNHVIIQVKSSGSDWSNDVITTRFLVLIRGKQNHHLE